MKDRNKLSIWKSAGLVWASLGLAILTLTLLGVAWIQFVAHPLPTEGVFALLALGGVPATISMLLGLWRGFRAKKEHSALSPDPVYSPGIRISAAGLVLLLLGAVAFAGDCLRRESKQRQWMAEALVVVEQDLHAADRIPADMRKHLGPFQDLSTRHVIGCAAWSVGGWLLQSNGEAQFQNGTIPVRINIIRSEKSDGNREVVIRNVERNKQLYPFYRGDSLRPMEGLEFWVSHPDIKAL